MGIRNWYRVARERKEWRRSEIEAKFKIDCSVLGEEGGERLKWELSLTLYVLRQIS